MGQVSGGEPNFPRPGLHSGGPRENYVNRAPALPSATTFRLPIGAPPRRVQTWPWRALSLLLIVAGAACRGEGNPTTDAASQDVGGSSTGGGGETHADESSGAAPEDDTGSTTGPSAVDSGGTTSSIVTTGATTGSSSAETGSGTSGASTSTTTGASGEESTGEEPPPCTPNGRARNPLVSHIFTADPNAVVYGDRVYLYVSHDVDGQETFDMVDYRGFSSSDMVNWRDHGVLIHADSLPWATNLYAPGACAKDGKYYLYIPNSGSGIGVAVADDPGGPFVDPLGTALVTQNTPGVTDVDWLFDPACFVDDDGQGYLYFGGGPENTGDNARVIRLGDDMTSLADASATTIVVPAFFEAAHMFKRDGTYYLQYSSDFSPEHGAALEYMTSDDPMTGFQHRGVLLPNAAINRGNNNHGSMVDFMDHTYLFYHARKLEQELGVDKVNNRSVAVQEITFAADGTIQPITMSTEDFTVEQLRCLDGHAEVQAETLAAERGIEVEGRAGETVYVAQISDGDWIGYSQVDFRAGATSLVLRVASAAGGGTIDVTIDGCITGEPGTSLGTCDVAATGGADAYAELTCTIAATSGPHDLCLEFSGNPAFTIDSWHLE